MKKSAAIIVALAAVAGVTWTASKLADRTTDAIPTWAGAGKYLGLEFHVTYRVKESSHGKDGGVHVHRVEGDFCFTNRTRSDLRLKFPLARSVLFSKSSVVYETQSRLDEPFRNPRVVVLKPGESFTITARKTIATGSSLPELHGRTADLHYGFVFDVPDDANPDEWVSGTIVSEPVEWRADEGLPSK